MAELDDPSAVFREESRFWMQRVVVPFLVCLGAAGNIVSIIVLTRKRMRSSTNIYLTGLALSDVTYLLFTLVLSFQHYPNVHDRKYELYWRFYGISHWFADAASYTSVWLTVSFTIERYIVVCHPIKGKALSTEGRAKSIVTIVGILCLVATATTPFEYQLAFKEYCIQNCEGDDFLQQSRQVNQTEIHNSTIINNQTSLSNCSDHYQSYVQEEKIPVNEEALDIFTNSTQRLMDVVLNVILVNTTCCDKNYTIHIEATNLGKNPLYQHIFYWFSSIVFAILPLAMISTFNCFLVKTVFKYHKKRKLMTNTQDKMSQVQENRITVLLIAVVVLFLLCQIPWAIFLIYDTLNESADAYTENIKRGLGNFFNCLLTINASGNFVLYCALSEKFRRTFKATFCSRTRNMTRNDALIRNGRNTPSRPRSSSRKRILRKSDYTTNTPRNLETTSLNSIPNTTKSLMQRPLGQAKTSDLVV